MDKKIEDVARGISLKSSRLNREEIFFPSQKDALFNVNLVGKFSFNKSGLLSLNLGAIGLKIKNGFVGIGGFYYKPKYFGCEDVKTFVDSWNWFIDKLSINEEKFSQTLEANSIVHLLIVGFDEGLLFYLFALIHELFFLDSLGVDVEQKILEIRKKITGNLRSYSKWENRKISEAFKRLQFLKSDLANLSSESGLAVFAKRNGFSLKIGVKPDLLIEGKKIEVKNRITPKRMLVVGLSKNPEIVEDNWLASLKNPIDDGLKQEPDIIAIEVSELNKRDVKGYKLEWIARGKLKAILHDAINFRGKKKLILLFKLSEKGVMGRLVIIKKIKIQK